jgi:hypothetical protein
MQTPTTSSQTLRSVAIALCLACCSHDDAAAARIENFANHDVGRVTLGVNALGSVGFRDEQDRVDNNGFRLISDATSTLYVASLWAGTSAAYVCNRDYTRNSDPDPFEWQMERGIIPLADPESDQDFEGIFNDGGYASLRGIQVRLLSMAWADAAAEDFVILDYTITNESASPITDYYAGLFCDFDIVDFGGDSTIVDLPGQSIIAFNANLGREGVSYGIAFLGDVSSVTSSQNREFHLTGIQNLDFVFDEFHVVDENKMKLLSGELNFEVAGGDISMLAGLGPYDLAPGESVEVAFAMGYGDSTDDLASNFEIARSRMNDVWAERQGVPVRTLSFGELRALLGSNR